VPLVPLLPSRGVGIVVLWAKFVVMDTAVQLLGLVSMTLVVKEVATTVTVVMVVKAGIEVLVLRLVASLAQGVPWVPPVWWTPPRRLPSQILLPVRRTCCKRFMP